MIKLDNIESYLQQLEQATGRNWQQLEKYGQIVLESDSDYEHNVPYIGMGINEERGDITIYAEFRFYEQYYEAHSTEEALRVVPLLLRAIEIVG